MPCVVIDLQPPLQVFVPNVGVAAVSPGCRLRWAGSLFAIPRASGSEDFGEVFHFAAVCLRRSTGDGYGLPCSNGFFFAAV